MSQSTATNTPMPPFAKPNGRGKGTCIAKQVFPRFNLLLPNEPAVVDIEMQEHRLTATDTKWSHRLGWIAIGNTRKESVLDVFVRYPSEEGRETKPGLRRFGVTEERLMEENGAVDGRIVEGWVRDIFKGRVVVLHGGGNDLKSFMFEDVFAGAAQIIDTQHLYGTMGRPQPGLKTLASEILGKVVQVDTKGRERHSPVQDAETTMELFLRRRPYDRVAAWNAWVAMSGAEKAKYLASGPKVLPEHYQRPTGGRGGHRGRGGPGRGGSGVQRGGRGGRGGGQIQHINITNASVVNITNSGGDTTTNINTNARGRSGYRGRGRGRGGQEQSFQQG